MKATVLQVKLRVVERDRDIALMSCGHVVDLGEHDPSNESLVGAKQVCTRGHLPPKAQRKSRRKN